MAGEYFSLGIQRNAKFTLLRRPVVETFQNSLPSSASNRPDPRGIKNRSDRTTNRLQLTSISSSQDERADSNSTAIYSILSDTASIADSRTAAIIMPVSVVDKASEDVSVATLRDMLRENAPSDESASSRSRVAFTGSDPRKRLQRESETARSEQEEERLGSEHVNPVDKTGGLNELEAVLGKHGSRREDNGKDKQNEGKPDSLTSTLLPVTTLNDRSMIDVSTKTMELLGSKEPRSVVRTSEVKDNDAKDVQYQHASSILQKRIPTIVFSGLR